jgi:hypothetical protein
MVAVASAPAPASWTLEAAWSIPNGTPVHDVNGTKIGKVCDADIDALVVSHGRIFVQEVAIAMADVDRVEEGRLVLKVTKDAVLNGERT